MKNFYLVLLILFLLNSEACTKKQKVRNTIDLAPVRELILYDRGGIVPYQLDLPRILKQKDSIEITELGITAHKFSWGGETGGPWNRVISFCRDTGIFFQRNFFFDGEYEMSIMSSSNCPLKEGINVPLGRQLTRLSQDLGPEIYLDRGRMRDLLLAVMEKLLHCPRVTEGYLDSLMTTRQLRIDDPVSRIEFLKSIEKVKWEITKINDPYVLFFQGELINGIWKGTVRQYDHTGRNCIDLEYLNGKFAYTIWL